MRPSGPPIPRAVGSTVTSARVAGALLVERGLVTPSQLAEALEHQRAHGGELDEILATLFELPLAVLTEVMNDRDAATRVDIGSILLANGAVDEERLAEARERSVGSGQPVGPILVEMGAISRLDLASALADQWSDSPAQILPPPGARERLHLPSMPGESVDDLRFAMAALEASVRAASEAGDESTAVEELLRRENALAERIASLEDAIDQPVEADPALVAEIRGIAEGLETLQTTLADVASTDDVSALGAAVAEVTDLRNGLEGLEARLNTAAPLDLVEEVRAEAAALAARVAGVESAGAELEALSAAIAGLESRPQIDPGLGERLEELGRAVDALGVLAEATTGVDGLQEAIAGLAARVDEAGATVARVEELAAAVAETRAEVESLRGLPERLAGLDGLPGRTEELSAALADLRAIVDELAARETQDPALAERVAELGELPGRAEGLASALDELRRSVEELALREAHDPAPPDHLADLVGLPARAEELSESIEVLRAELAEVLARPQIDPGLAERVEELAELRFLVDDATTSVAALRGEVDALSDWPEADALLTERIEGLAAEIAASASTVAAVPELAAEVASAAGRLAAVEGLEREIVSLRSALDELGSRPAGDAGLAERVELLVDRVEALSAEALGPAAEAAVAGVAARVQQVADAQEESAGRLELLRARLDELRDEVSAFPQHDGTGERVEALAELLDHLVERVDGAAPASALAALVVAVEELRGLQAPIEARVVALDGRLAEAEVRAAGAQQSADEALGAVRDRLQAVADEAEARFEAVLARLDRVETASEAGAPPDDDLRGEVAALGAAIETVRASVAADLARVEGAWATERAALEEMIATLAVASDGSGQGVADGGGAASPSAPELAKLARELERVSDRVMEQERSLVEHFARRERALIERLGAGTDVGQRLTELTRGVDELRSRIERVGAGGGGGEGGPSAEELAALKESLFSRLERLASSIDWRFQRLEGGPAAAAGRTDLHTRVEQLARVVELLANAEGIEGVGLAPEASHDVFLALVPTATGHQLVELPGDAPGAGAVIPAPLGKGELLVVAVGTSPLPGDDRACVFVEPVDAATPA